MQSLTSMRQLLSGYRRSRSGRSQFQFKKRFLVMFALATVLSVLTLVATFSTGITQVHAVAATICSRSEQSYTVVRGDTLGKIAARYGTSWSALASRNRISNPNIIFTGQHVCVPRHKTSTAKKVAAPVHTGTNVRVKRVLAPARPATTSVSGMINSIFGSYAGSAMRIAVCESGLNPNASNPIYIGGSHAAGVFQILYPSTWYTTSQRNASPYNAYANIVAAHDIFVRDGYSWREWTCR